MATPDLSKAELEVLAYTVLGEAGGEGASGMADIMNVIMNRTKSGRYSENPAAVALEKNAKGIHQFSTWNTKENGGNSPISRYSKNSKEFKQALEIVQKVMAGEIPDETGGATHFVSKAMYDSNKPKWWDAEAPGGAIERGGHVFGAKTQVAAKPDVMAANAAVARGVPPLPRPRPDTSNAAGEVLAFAPTAYAPNGAGATPTSAAARAAAALGGAAREGGGSDSGLTNRVVTTVPIDPLTGNPIRPAVGAGSRVGRGIPLIAANANLQQAQKEQGNLSKADAQLKAAGVTDVRDLGDLKPGGVAGTYKDLVRSGASFGNTTVIVRADGTVVQVPKAGSVAMPRDVTPQLNKPTEPVDPSAPAALRGSSNVGRIQSGNVVYQPEPARQAAAAPNSSGGPDDRGIIPPGARLATETQKVAVLKGASVTAKPVMKTISYQTTIQVKNPNYKPMNSSGSPDDRDAAAARARLGAGAGLVGAAAVEPEFIQKVVTLQKEIEVGSPVVAPRKLATPVLKVPTPNKRVIQQDTAARLEKGKVIAAANRKNPNPTYDISGGDNAFNPRSVQESLRWQTGY